jgi:hypothetical protein
LFSFSSFVHLSRLLLCLIFSFSFLLLLHFVLLPRLSNNCRTPSFTCT